MTSIRSIAVAVGIVVMSPLTATTPAQAQSVANAESLSPAGRLQVIGSAARLSVAGGDIAVLERMAGAAGPANLGAALQGDDRRLFSRLVGQSLQFVSVQGDRGVTAWFNPLEDVWIIGIWAPAGSAWRLTSLGAATSDQLSGGDSAPWSRRAPTLVGALSAQGMRGRDLFRAVIAPGASDAAVLDPARSSQTLADAIGGLRLQYRRLAMTRRLEGYQGYLGDLESSFVSHTSDIQGDETIRARILDLPPEARLSLTAVMGFSRPDGETIAVQSPYAPGLVFIVHFRQASPTSAARPVRIECADLLQGAA